MKPVAYKLKEKFNGTRTDDRGNVFWYRDGLLHRDGDLPAIEYKSGKKMWYRHGLKHRDGAPAVIWADGSEIWFRNGERHRDDGPAEIFKSDGGMKRWYRDGLLHRDGAPAIEGRGAKWWYQGGALHREDGPAIVSSSGSTAHYLFGERWPEGDAVTDGNYAPALASFVHRLTLSGSAVTLPARIRIKPRPSL